MARVEATMRLATYGTLAPGKPNHHELSALEGRWLDGTVRGSVMNDGWGVALGYPGLILDEHGLDVQVKVLESADLPAHWPRLDMFEGLGYRRVVVPVQTAEGPRAVGPPEDKLRPSIHDFDGQQRCGPKP